MTYDEINAFGAQVQAELLEGDHAIIVSFAALPADSECDLPSCIATVRGIIDHRSHEYTGHGVHLADAIGLARGKLRAAREKHRLAKAEKVS